MSKKRTRVLHMALIAIISLGVLGCGSSDPSTAEYWESQLNSPQRKQAIRQLAGLGEKAVVALPALIKTYNKGKDKGEIIRTLSQLKLNRPEVIDLLARALSDTTEQSAAVAAADALGDLGAKSKIADLMAVLGRDMEDEVKAAVLRSMVKFKDPSTVDDLIKVVDGDPDKQWIHLNSLACEALGEIGPPAANKALPSLVRGIFLRDRFQRLSFRDCAIALIKFGDQAGQAVVDAMDGKDPVLQKLAAERGFVDGLIPEEGVKMLSLLRYKPAAPRVQQELVIKLVPPTDYDEKKREMWAIIEAQRFQNSIDALGRLGDENTVPELAKWLYKDEYLRRVRVPVALATIGGEQAYKELLKAANTVTVDKDNTWFRIDVAQYLAYIARPEQTKDLESVLKVLEKIEPDLKELEAKSPGAGAKDFLDRLEGYRQNLAAIKECGATRECWEGKLKATHLHVREKAVWELARMSATDPKAMDALLANVSATDFELRNAVLQALPLVCDQRCAEPIRKVLKDEEGKTAFKGFRDVMQFVLVQVEQKKAPQ